MKSNTKKQTKKPAKKQKQLITKDMTLGDILNKYPATAEVMLAYGLHCIGCHLSPFESLEAGSMGHGMSQKDFNALLKDINAVAEKSKKQKKD